MTSPHSHTDPARYAFCPQCGAALTRRVVKAGEPERLVCSACEFIFFLDPKLAAGCIIEHEGGIVLLRRAIEPGYGKWVFPGGYVDRGESVPDAARREVEEEVCLQVALGDLVGIYSYTGRPIVVVVYAARVVGGKLTAADEALEARAFAASDLPWDELAFTSTYDALADYMHRLHAVQPPSGSRKPLPF